MPQPPLILAIELIALLLVLYKLRTFVNLGPSMVACMLRWKESVNLEESLDLARERDKVYFIILIPDLLLTARYNLAGLDFTESWSPELKLCAAAGLFLTLALIRLVPALILGKGRCSGRLYQAFMHSFRNFAICTSLTGLAAAGICSAFAASDDITRNILYGIMGICYLLYLIRKGQIFASANTGFSSFLYLCALELLPTALTLAAAILF